MLGVDGQPNNRQQLQAGRQRRAVLAHLRPLLPTLTCGWWIYIISGLIWLGTCGAALRSDQYRFWPYNFPSSASPVKAIGTHECAMTMKIFQILSVRFGLEVWRPTALSWSSLRDQQSLLLLALLREQASDSTLV